MIGLPAGLLALDAPDPTWQPWLAALPRRVDDLLADWSLTPDGDPWHGRCALVLPVGTADGEPAALKVTWPHDEAALEHLALQHWHGQGAVRLLRADPHRWALLLERLHPRDLTSLDDVEACEVVGDLLARLRRPAPPQLTLLSHRVTTWTERLAALPADAALPHRLVARAVALGRELAADPATDGTLTHTDLHDENVLAADRAPWLAIDPKPLSGDQHYEVAPSLWNRWAEVLATGDVRRAVRRRFDALVDAAGLDPDRARDWVVVRELHQALWTVEAAADRGRAPDAAEREWITRAVTIAKAVLD